MKRGIINLGFENFLPVEQIIAVLSIEARYIKPLISRAELENRLLNLTRKRKTRSVILTKEGYLLLTVVTPKTLNSRLEKTGVSTMAIGENNFLNKDEVLIILNNNSTQIETLVKKARAQIKVFNTQSGNITESYIYTKSGYIFLSKMPSKTLSTRYSKEVDLLEKETSDDK